MSSIVLPLCWCSMRYKYKTTIPDVGPEEVFDWHNDAETMMKDYPNILEWRTMMKNHPNMKAFLESDRRMPSPADKVCGD